MKILKEREREEKKREKKKEKENMVWGGGELFGDITHFLQKK